MAQHRVPVEVQNAIQLARDVMEAKPKSGWSVSIRNEKVVITAPDKDEQGNPRPVNLTIGMNPNQESLKKFIREASKFNLIGAGPARTPAEQQEILDEAEREGLKRAEEENKKRMAYESQQAKKSAEAKVAADKAKAATAPGLAAPAAPAPSSDGFPEFDPSLLGSMDYPKFVLPNGHSYCIECLGAGVKFSTKKPQGLATHRGFRHQMYQGEGVVSTPANNQENSRVILPGDIQDAIELLRSVVADHVQPEGANPEQIAALEARIAEITQQADMDLKKADADYQELKNASEAALKAEQTKVHSLTGELSGLSGRQQAETTALMTNFQALLVKIRQAVNGMSPAQAVGEIDKLLTEYL